MYRIFLKPQLRSSVFYVYIEHITQIFLVFSLLTLKKKMPSGQNFTLVLTKRFSFVLLSEFRNVSLVDLFCFVK